MNLRQLSYRTMAKLRGPRRWRITGPFRGITGYDRVVRSLVPLLIERGITVEMRELKNWTPTRSEEPEPFRMEHTSKLKFADLHLHICMPSQVVRSTDCANLNWTMFEADRIPESWSKASREMDLMIVPTESSREVWVNAGIAKEKILLCPQGTDFALFTPRMPPLPLATIDGRPVNTFKYRFLNVAEFIARKNLKGLLRAWFMAVSKRDDAVLILKPGFYRNESRESFRRMLREVESETGKAAGDSGPVVVCDRKLTNAEMPGLYTAATHYWSMSCGEGFDLPMMEAAACDLQLIAPAHSAYLSYLSTENAHLLSVEKVSPQLEDTPDLAALFEGAKWWQPSELHAANLIRSIIAGNRGPTISSREALADFTWANTADRMIRLINGKWLGMSPW